MGILGNKCRLLCSLPCRYDDLLFESNDYGKGDSNAALPDDVSRGGKHKHSITELNIYVASNDQSLNLQTDESYVLEIEAPTSSISVGQKLGMSSFEIACKS